MWYIHYESGVVVGLRSVSTLGQAIKQACEILDRGLDVSKIDGPGGRNKVGIEEIRAAYAKLR